MLGISRRNQSNFNRSIYLDWVRQSNIIELTQTFCQWNTVEHFFNRTETNSRPIELCLPNRFHLVSNSALQPNKLSVGFYFNHVHPAYTEKTSQVKLTIFEVVVKGYREYSFAISVGEKYIVGRKRGDRGPPLKVLDENDQLRSARAFTTRRLSSIGSIHLIPKWQKIPHSYVSLLIDPCCLVLSQIFL